MEKREDGKGRGVSGRRGARQETREGWKGKEPGVGGRLGEGVSVEQAASSSPPELGDQGLCGQVRRGQRLTAGLEATEDGRFLTDRLCHQPPDLWGRSTIPAPALGAWVRVLTPQGSSFLSLRGLGHRYRSPPGTTGGSNGSRLTGALRAELSPPYRHFPPELEAAPRAPASRASDHSPPCVHLWSLPLPFPVPVRLSLISATEIPPRKT